MRCPYCNNHVLQKSGTQTKLRTRGPLVFKDDICLAKCFWCKKLVEIPIQIQQGIEIASEQFIVSTK